MRNNYTRTRPLLLLLIPLTVIILDVIFKKATGPYWLGANSDPAYLYLLNSLYLIKGIAPFFVDHPGTTLQLLGAWLIKLSNIGLTTPQIIDKVFTVPEYYLNALHQLLLFLYVSSLTALGFYGLRKTKNILFALILQAPSLLFFTLKGYNGNYVLPVITHINSDTLIMTIINLYVMCIIKLYHDKTPREHTLSAILLGIVCALGLTTKFTFFPMFLGPVILLPKIRKKLLFAISFLATWFLVALPIMSRYHTIYLWIRQLFTRPQGAGAPEKAVLNIHIYLSNFNNLISNHLFLFLLLNLCVITIISKLIRKRCLSKLNLFLLAITLSCIGQFFLIAIKPAPHYMAPAVGVIGLLLGLLYLSSNISPTKKNPWTATGLIILVIILITHALYYEKKLRATNTAMLNFSQEIYTKYKDCAIFGHYRSSAPHTAIEFAESHGAEKIFAELLRKKYPTALFYNRFHHTFHDFYKNVMLANIVKKQNKSCAMLYGSTLDFSEGFLTVEEIEAVGSERLYRIKSTTLDQAHKYYLTALSLESNKKYKMAYIFALKAKQLGRPAVNPYLKKLKNLIESQHGQPQGVAPTK